MKKQQMTLENYLEIANHLSIIQHHFRQVYEKLNDYHSNSSQVIKHLTPYLPGNVGNLWGKMLNALDSDYHQLINADNLKKHGYIYYSLQERFKNMENIKSKKTKPIKKGI